MEPLSALRYRIGSALYGLEDRQPLLWKAIAPALLAVAVALGVYLRALPAINYGLMLYEADPFVVYWQAKYMVEHGILSWYTLTQDNPATHIFWYPWGRDFVHSEYPAMAMWEAISYIAVGRALGFDLLRWAALQTLPVAALTIVFMYMAAKEITNSRVAGLAAAFLYAVVPGATGRTIVGFSTKYGLGIMFIVLFVYFYARFIRSHRAGSPAWKQAALATASALSLSAVGYSWGGFVYIYGAFVAFVVLLPILAPKEAKPALVASSAAIAVASLALCAGSPAVWANLGLLPARLTSIGIISAGALVIPLGFSLVYNEYKFLGLRRPPVGRGTYVLVLLALVAGGVALTLAGVVDIAGRFAWILGLRELASNPIFASVEEHQPALTTLGISGILRDWGTYNDALFFVSPFVFALLGSLYLFYRGGPERIFVGVASLLAIYAYMNAAYMEVTAISTGLIAAGAFAGWLLSQLVPSREEYERARRRRIRRGGGGSYYVVLALSLLFVANVALVADASYDQMNHVVPSIYAGYASLPYKTQAWMKAIDIIRNMSPNALVVSWWDYGYPISVLGGRATLADGSTLNTTQIGMLGLILTATNDTQAVELLRALRAPPNDTYVLVFDTFTFRPTGNGSYDVMPIVMGSMVGIDDIPKSIWMIRIGDSVLSDVRKVVPNASGVDVGNAFYLYLFQNGVLISPRFDDLAGAPLLYRMLVDAVLYLNKEWNATVTFTWYSGSLQPINALQYTQPSLYEAASNMGITGYIQVTTTVTLDYGMRPLANNTYFIPYHVVAEPYVDRNGQPVMVGGAYLYEVIAIYKVVFPSS